MNHLLEKEKSLFLESQKDGHVVKSEMIVERIFLFRVLMSGVTNHTRLEMGQTIFQNSSSDQKEMEVKLFIVVYTF